MYRVRQDKGMLLTGGDYPQLYSSDCVWDILETLPEHSVVPVHIINLGIITLQLRVTDREFETAIPDKNAIKSEKKPKIPPKTMAAVPHFLRDVADELSEERKALVGKFCEAKGLNKHPKQGMTSTNLNKIGRKRYKYVTLYIKEKSTDAKVDDRNKNSNSSTRSPFASGKEITTKGGERITGKNPHADTERIKDTGLHQGGG